MALEHRLLSADDDGDFPGRSLVNPARDRRLEGEHALFRRDCGEALDRVGIVGAHFDPGSAGRETGERPVGSGQHPFGNGRGGEAGDHRVDPAGERARRIRPGGAGRQQRFRRFGVDVVHDKLEAGAPEASGKRPAKTA